MNLRDNVEKKKQCELSSPALSQRHPPHRSRSIKIPSDDRRESLEDPDSIQLQEHYNSATLRMYYRITDYRNRNALHASNGHSNNVGATNPPLTGAAYSHHVNLVTPVDDEESATTSYPSEESDAIFEMDL
jgi:hypothetical protein